jgi:hypothetical protein
VVRELVQHSDFGQREGAAQVAVLEHADATGIEAIELADAVDALVNVGDHLLIIVDAVK